MELGWAPYSSSTISIFSLSRLARSTSSCCRMTIRTTFGCSCSPTFWRKTPPAPSLIGVPKGLRLQRDEWPDLPPLVQSVFNNVLPRKHANVPHIKSINRLDASLPISIFYCANASNPVTITNFVDEDMLKKKRLSELVNELKPTVPNALQENRKRMRDQASKGKLPNFTEGNFILVDCDNVTAVQKLLFHWRVPRFIVKAMNIYVFQVKDLRNGVYRWRTYIPYQGPPWRVSWSRSDHAACICIWKWNECATANASSREGRRTNGPSLLAGFTELEDTIEPIIKIYEDVPELFRKQLCRKRSIILTLRWLKNCIVSFIFWKGAYNKAPPC